MKTTYSDISTYRNEWGEWGEENRYRVSYYSSRAGTVLEKSFKTRDEARVFIKELKLHNASQKLSKEKIKNNLKKWIKALRSGKYSQIQHKLSNSSGYCCLGVACEVLNLSRNDYDEVIEENDAANKLNLSLKKQDKLTHLNDDSGYTFEKIADYIEKNYLKNL